MEIVNGIPCLNCSDVERAKKAPQGDVNPLNLNDLSSVSRDFARSDTLLTSGSRGRTVNLGV
jgi:hypothetical protein